MRSNEKVFVLFLIAFIALLVSIRMASGQPKTGEQFYRPRVGFDRARTDTLNYGEPLPAGSVRESILRAQDGLDSVSLELGRYGMLNLGDKTGFDTMFTQLYLRDSEYKIGMLNPTHFVQSVFTVVVQDSFGNTQNTGLFAYESRLALGDTAEYVGGVEGDVYSAGAGHVLRSAAVTAYNHANKGTTGNMFSFWDGSNTVENPGTHVQTNASFFGGVQKVQWGARVGTSYGGYFSAMVAYDTAAVETTYGLFVNGAGSGRILRYNAYFSNGITAVDTFQASYFTPSIKIRGTATLNSSTQAFQFTPTVTSTANQDIYTMLLAPIVNTPNGASTTQIQGVRILAPDITLGSGSTANNSTTLYIGGASTEASANWGIYVDGNALSKFTGGIDIGLTSTRVPFGNTTGGLTDSPLLNFSLSNKRLSVNTTINLNPNLLVAGNGGNNIGIVDTVGGYISFYDGGGNRKGYFGYSAGHAADKFVFTHNSIDFLAGDGSGNVTLGGSVTTSAPTGSTAGAWKLGLYSGTAPTATGKIRITIGSAKYDIPAELIP